MRCSCCLSRSVCVWMFLSLASCSASTHFAFCNARSPSSCFSAASCEECSVVRYYTLFTALHVGVCVVWVYLAKGLHLLGSRLESQGCAAYSLFLSVQFFSQFFQSLSLLCHRQLLLFQLCSVELQVCLFLQQKQRKLHLFCPLGPRGAKQILTFWIYLIFRDLNILQNFFGHLKRD